MNELPITNIYAPADKQDWSEADFTNLDHGDEPQYTNDD